MNFLGHIFLTPDDDQLLLGNFIADSVKGNPERLYSGRIVDGIRFHRNIDDFTDKHPIVKQGIERFRETQGRWAPVVIDVIYDHILASDWNLHHEDDLQDFVQSAYSKLDSLKGQFPAPVGRYFPYMKAQNWLFNYQFEWGLKKSLEGLDRRTSIATEMHRSIEVFKENETQFRMEFQEFISDAQKMASDYFSS